jgi:hypothetical protein
VKSSWSSRPKPLAGSLVSLALPESKVPAGRFSKRPDRAVTVLLFATHDAFTVECVKVLKPKECERDLGLGGARGSAPHHGQNANVSGQRIGTSSRLQRLQSTTM